MEKQVQLERDIHGVFHIRADDEVGLFWGQGRVHALDRGHQILLMRILGQGRASELLEASETTLEIDTFFRRLNWTGQMSSTLDDMSEETRLLAESYCKGVNSVIMKKVPLGLRFLRYKPEPWTIEDLLLLSRMVGYLTLSQSQGEMERLIVEFVQAGLSDEQLNELFPGELEGLDRELLGKVKLTERVVPESVRFNMAIPRMMASNNWVVAGTKTASGEPMVANDPHLETNRLPNIWMEVVMKSPDSFAIGGSMPGIPGVLVGRNPHVAWGVTYSFMDATDSWIEHCKDGKYRRGSEWLPFKVRKEVIKRKKTDPIEVTFYENNHGVLDGNPSEEGYYLTTRWASADTGGESINQLLKLFKASTVDQAMDAAGRVETSWSFVMADTSGDIGFQMSGLMPKRRSGISGLIPLPGWEPENDWQGFCDYKELPRIKNPDSGFIVTANHDLNHLGVVRPINLPMGSYRADRIEQLLEKNNSLTKEDFFSMHYDVLSLQAEQFMAILKPLLPDTAQGNILGDWDFCYKADSVGAYLFEEVYKALYREIFGTHGVGVGVIDQLEQETSIFADFYRNFDTILLSEKSSWFGGESRDELYTKIIGPALDTEIKTLGDVRKFMMTNILFGGKFPAFFGFDRGPIVGIGGRATIHQGQIYRSGNRTTTFFPSFRVVMDLADEQVYTNLAGGPSDSRFSKWYCSDLQNWIKGNYKILQVF